MGRVKYSFFTKMGIESTNILHLAPNNVKGSLLTSLKVNRVNKVASCNNIGIVTLTAQGALWDFILLFTT